MQFGYNSKRPGFTGTALLLILDLLFYALGTHALKPHHEYLHARSPNKAALARRTVPTYETILHAVIDQTDDLRDEVATGKKLATVFYTKLPTGITGAEEWCEKNLGAKNFATYNQAVSAVNMRKFRQATTTSTEVESMQKLVSRALAETAEDEIILLIPHGVEWDPKSTWQLYEFPGIQHNNENRAVVVVRIDPTTNARQEIWKHGMTPTLPKPLDE